MDKAKVLVVEDNEQWQAAFARRYGEQFELLQATTIEQGEELFSANPDIGIVVMDAGCNHQCEKHILIDKFLEIANS